MTQEFDDIFAGYKNDLQKAVALVEWQRAEIETLTINMNAFGIAAKRLSEERREVATNALLELKRQIHDHAIYPHGAGINPCISLKLVDAIIQDALKHV